MFLNGAYGTFDVGWYIVNLRLLSDKYFDTMGEWLKWLDENKD